MKRKTEQLGLPRGHLATAEEFKPLIRKGQALESAYSTTDVGVQAQEQVNDIHNHTIGPRYSHTQVKDFSKTLAENAISQMSLFDEAGVHHFVWEPIPTIIVEGKSVLMGACGNHDHDHGVDVPANNSHDAASQQAGFHGGPSIGGKTYYMPESFRNGAPMTGEAYDTITKLGKQSDNTSVDWPVGKAYNAVKRMRPDLAEPMHPSITGIVVGNGNSVHAIHALKRAYPDSFYLMGEVTMHKKFVGSKTKLTRLIFGKRRRSTTCFALVDILACPSSCIAVRVMRRSASRVGNRDKVSIGTALMRPWQGIQIRHSCTPTLVG